MSVFRLARAQRLGRVAYFLGFAAGFFGVGL
jgi:hypothetical protein